MYIHVCIINCGGFVWGELQIDIDRPWQACIVTHIQTWKVLLEMVSHGLSSQHYCTSELTIKPHALQYFNFSFLDTRKPADFRLSAYVPLARSVRVGRLLHPTHFATELQDNTWTTATHITHEDVTRIDKSYFTCRSALIPHVWQKWQRLYSHVLSFERLWSGFAALLYINLKPIESSIRCPETKAKVAHATKMPLDLWKVETCWNLMKLNQTPTTFMQSRQALFVTQYIFVVLCLVSVMCQVYLPETSATCIPCPEGLDCKPGADEKDIGIKSTQRSHITRTARIAVATKHHTDILKIP